METIIKHWLDKYNSFGNSMIDIAFDNLSFIQEREPIYNIKGEKVSKSYYDTKNREAVRICYNKVFGEHIYEDVKYKDVFIGLQKTIKYIDLAGNVAYEKQKQIYLFELAPVFNRLDAENVAITFSSPKQRQVLKEERYAADDYLQSQNPTLYTMLYSRYMVSYELYLKTGKKERLVNSMNNETDENINAVFNNTVFGNDDLTVKELILMNLQ